MGKTSEAFYFDDFYLRNGKLYYKDKNEPLTKKGGKLRSVGVIAGYDRDIGQGSTS